MSITISSPALRNWMKDVFHRLGASERASAFAAAALHFADLHGLDTHGIANLERIYVRKCESHEIDPAAEPQLIVNSGAIAVVDGRCGLGMVAAQRSMRLAIQKARRLGIGAVAVRNSSHFGAAGYYTTMASRVGLIGIAMTNLGSQAIAPPPGGLIPMLGTNPISLAAPAGDLAPFVLDMSTTAAATGKIRQAARRGEPIPAGWLADRDGQPVVDPGEFDRGRAYLQFAGGHKGFGLAVLVDILCGVLSGAAVGPSRSGTTADQSDGDIGHFLLVLNPQAFHAPAFRQRMDDMLQSLLDCPTASPERSVRYAGYTESTIRRERLARGIPLDTSLATSLDRLAGRLGLPALTHHLV